MAHVRVVHDGFWRAVFDRNHVARIVFGVFPNVEQGRVPVFAGVGEATLRIPGVAAHGGEETEAIADGYAYRHAIIATHLGAIFILQDDRGRIWGGLETALVGCILAPERMTQVQHAGAGIKCVTWTVKTVVGVEVGLEGAAGDGFEIVVVKAPTFRVTHIVRLDGVARGRHLHQTNGEVVHGGEVSCPIHAEICAVEPGALYILDDLVGLLAGDGVIAALHIEMPRNGEDGHRLTVIHVVGAFPLVFLGSRRSGVVSVTDQMTLGDFPFQTLDGTPVTVGHHAGPSVTRSGIHDGGAVIPNIGGVEIIFGPIGFHHSVDVTVSLGTAGE